MIWVVTDYELTIQRLPKYNETITIKTEAVAYNKFFCHRMFYIYDAAGNLLLDILCYFVLIDFETRKVAPVPEDLIAPYQFLSRSRNCLGLPSISSWKIHLSKNFLFAILTWI
ncbi:Acyl-ACP thioesterase [Streptococcus suis 05ZYH33]|nr:Acyl-ACP thioesterase [Streptococcus suis 05ZYH33]